MRTFQVVSMVVCLVAVFGYQNHRFVRLPDAISITAIGVVVSIGAVVLARFDAAVATEMRVAVARIDFPAVLLLGVLGLLLFAGSPAHRQPRRSHREMADDPVAGDVRRRSASSHRRHWSAPASSQ
ncbi:hypothetical protein [Variovorax sp. LG9.2]|uniref:hypothetical protein n=1 Tax=Variovorax sp. LG9.2 TaxID=3048626 RepID=UPI002B23113A|nr:hypothetical protein [Variovorax sp. LG9.2]MEB0059651.1 hypothetical protein [Variovorax sp. LG9.2]